ncbi:hypothetical protein [Streptomyces xinghaiensis]|uniref:hypothetical protein n=1 Tax=Streptomyces xinghaiensis TaxID=1038928 RepID=UPI00343D6EAF
MEITTARGTVGGRLLRPPGAPGWGTWYATAPLPERDRAAAEGAEGPDGPDGPDAREASAPVGRVTVYGTRGAVLAEPAPGAAGSTPSGG